MIGKQAKNQHKIVRDDVNVFNEICNRNWYIYVCKEQYRWAIRNLFRLARITRSQHFGRMIRIFGRAKRVNISVAIIEGCIFERQDCTRARIIWRKT